MKSENFTHTLSTKLRPRATKILDRKLKWFNSATRILAKLFLNITLRV